MSLLKPHDKYSIISKEEAIERIEELSYYLYEYLLIKKEYMNFKKINLIGIGNSISAGWSKVDQDVMPFIKKFERIYRCVTNDKELLKMHSFTLMDKNSNNEIYNFLLSNPSPGAVFERFQIDFQNFRQKFKFTPFRNKIDWEKAKTLYEKEGKSFFQIFYDSRDVNITLFNGFTGGLLNEPQKMLSLRGREEIMNDEMLYAGKIVDLLKQLRSYVIIGNFPEFSTSIGNKLNYIINEFNRQIKSFSEKNGCTFLDIVTLQGFQKYNGKIYIDNHPTINEQYTSLYKFVSFLCNQYLPETLEKENVRKKQVK